MRGLARPLAVRDAIQKLAGVFSGELPWAQLVRQIATLDWIIGAVIAAHAGCDIPPLPEEEALSRQNSSRELGKVRVGVEWGYEMHEIMVPFPDWVAILNGQWWSESEPYWYEGQQFIATWSFNGSGRLEVSYGDDGASGWEGRLRSADVIEGPQIDGIDVARLALKALRS